jgi:hypothetical protein
MPLNEDPNKSSKFRKLTFFKGGEQEGATGGVRKTSKGELE